MNMLHLLRHAKAAAKPEAVDRERPLSRRGREAARRLGKHLPGALGNLDLVLCSNARRTCETLDLVLTGFSSRPHVSMEEELYLASCERLINRLRRLDARDANVLLIGHNPGLHELALSLADHASRDFAMLDSGRFPTAAYASFRVPASWPSLGRSRHELVAYVTPQALRGGKG